MMSTFALAVLVAAVAALRLGSRATGLVAIGAAIAGVGVLASGGEPAPLRALAGASLMAAASVALASIYFARKIRIAFGVVMLLPFVFVAVSAWPLLQRPQTLEQAFDLILVSVATAVALGALGLAPPSSPQSAGKGE